ncbi:MAG: hypothetical protein QOE33_2013 [Acidobacteriota bacterium]|nr:hypothetical protein [Acidobacteriota bacterium]
MSKAAQMLVFTFSMALSCFAQDSNSICDFSSYKPLIVSHPLAGAIIKRVEPKYPGGGHLRVQSEVEVKIIVDRKGNVVAACITRGHPLLREAAVQAARE